MTITDVFAEHRGWEIWAFRPGSRDGWMACARPRESGREWTFKHFSTDREMAMRGTADSIDTHACLNCNTIVESGCLDNHLCNKCSELAETSTMNSLRHGAGLE